MDIASLRENYTKDVLTEESIHSDPFIQFDKWIQEAIKSSCREPNAMTLATVNQLNEPNARIVLLKAYSSEGFIFYTNYTSEKAIEIEHNNNVGIVFNWLELQRQIRIKGRTELVSRETSEKYFHSRPRASQIGAHVSSQSKVIPDRKHLETSKELFEKKFEGIENIPLPENWGGYRIVPSRIEFWQGRQSRLHDRLVFNLDSNDWSLERLAP